MSFSLKKSLEEAETISRTCSENCEWKASLQVLNLKVVSAVTSMRALCDLRKTSCEFQGHKVPREDDEDTIQDILNKNFPDWKEHIKEETKKHMNQMAVRAANTTAYQTVLATVRKPIKDVRLISVVLFK